MTTAMIWPSCAMSADFSGWMLTPLGVRECGLRGEMRQTVVERLALEQRLRFSRAPRHGGDATQRDTRIPDRAALDIERDRSRREREFIGLPVARLQVDGTRPT